MRLIHRLASVIFIVLSCSSCTMERQKTEAALDEIDSLLETDPSHALEAADQIRTEELATRRERARYALLYSAALDKNHIDICSDSIIHPAITYYIRKGSDRERSMTYYYTGRICENAHDSEKAMQALQRCTGTGAAYHYRLAQANEMSGKYKEAVESYKIYIGQSGMIGDGIIDQDTRFV